VLRCLKTRAAEEAATTLFNLARAAKRIARGTNRTTLRGDTHACTRTGALLLLALLALAIQLGYRISPARILGTPRRLRNTRRAPMGPTKTLRRDYAA